MVWSGCLGEHAGRGGRGRSDDGVAGGVVLPGLMRLERHEKLVKAGERDVGLELKSCGVACRGGLAGRLRGASTHGK